MSQQEKRNDLIINANMIERIKEFIIHHDLISPGSSIVLGLSGGPDSVFLLHVLCTLRDEGKISAIIAAHLDHQWRANSASDVVFCEQLAERYGVQFVSGVLKNFASQNVSGSKEEIGRSARRNFLTKIAQEHSASAIALAHHRDDQQETFFIRLLRGASLTGLTGMKPRHGLFIRPLLEISKQEILEYLEKHNIPYLIDPSNESHEFLRNRIRLTVIPALRACDERFDTNFAKTLKQLQETQEYLDSLAREIFSNITAQQNGVVQLDYHALLQQHPVMQKQLLLLWLTTEQVKFPVSSGFFDEILKFLRNPGKEHALHETWRLVKDAKKAWLSKKTDIPSN